MRITYPVFASLLFLANAALADSNVEEVRCLYVPGGDTLCVGDAFPFHGGGSYGWYKVQKLTADGQVTAVTWGRDTDTTWGSTLFRAEALSSRVPCAKGVCTGDYILEKVSTSMGFFEWKVSRIKSVWENGMADSDIVFWTGNGAGNRFSGILPGETDASFFRQIICRLNKAGQNICGEKDVKISDYGIGQARVIALFDNGIAMVKSIARGLHYMSHVDSMTNLAPVVSPDPTALPPGVIALPALYQCMGQCAVGLHCVDGCPRGAVCATTSVGFSRYFSVQACSSR